MRFAPSAEKRERTCRVGPSKRLAYPERERDVSISSEAVASLLDTTKCHQRVRRHAASREASLAELHGDRERFDRRVRVAKDQVRRIPAALGKRRDLSIDRAGKRVARGVGRNIRQQEGRTGATYPGSARTSAAHVSFA